MELRSFISILLLTAFLSSCLASSSKLSKTNEEVKTMNSATIDELINKRLQGVIDDIIANISILNDEMEDAQGHLSELDVKVELKTNQNSANIHANVQLIDTYGVDLEAIEEDIYKEVHERMGNDTILESMLATEAMDRSDAIEEEVNNRIQSEKEIQVRIAYMDSSDKNTVDYHETDLADKINATLECTTNANINVKLEIAFRKCHKISDFSQFHAWNISKGSDFISFLNGGDSCPTHKEIFDWIYLEYSADICILQHIDWLDDNFNILLGHINSDIKNLFNGFPPELMDNDNACKEEMILAVQQSVNEKCKSFYSVAESFSVQDVGEKIAMYECFLQKFEQQCLEFLPI